MATKDNNKVRVNISIPVDVHRTLKTLSAQNGTNVSQEISNLVSQNLMPTFSGYGIEQYHDRILKLTAETDARLEQWAIENHTTVSQAITDWIWKQKVKNAQLKGQLSVLG